MTVKEKIAEGKTYLGIELGSTRIKACLIDDTFAPIASGSHEWENRLENGLWTYSLDNIHGGLKACYADLKKDVKEKYGAVPETFGAMGISAMMHGYMAFDESDEILVPFRTWRNTNTEAAAKELSELFGFNIPMRWSVSHLYQAIINKEEHVPNIAHVMTLAAYVHFLLTGERVIGIGDASGMFPVIGGGYDKTMSEKFKERSGLDIEKLFPRILLAGEKAGTLTAEGAKFLDPEGDLKSEVPFCPPEGDAGTGMTATNSVRAGTGNISAGTSVFSMLTLEKPLKSYYPEIDMVATPDGVPSGMVHCNNCCGELDAWVNLFAEFAELSGNNIGKSKVYELLYKNALNGDTDCGGVTAYNFISAEPVAGVREGRPAYFRTPDSNMNIANFMRAELYSAFASLKAGMDILFEKENVSAKCFTGHGGIFKVRGAAQQILADALNTPVCVMETAGEGGAWGVALLAAFSVCAGGKALPDWLDKEVFANMEKTELAPDKAGSEGFAKYLERFKQKLTIYNE